MILRNPVERAVSMSYHRVRVVKDLDEGLTIEHYAQGMGIG